MKYTNSDIYENFVFINESGKGQEFTVREIDDNKCILYSTNSPIPYTITDVVFLLNDGTYLAKTPKTEAYEIY